MHSLENFYIYANGVIRIIAVVVMLDGGGQFLECFRVYRFVVGFRFYFRFNNRRRGFDFLLRRVQSVESLAVNHLLFTFGRR